MNDYFKMFLIALVTAVATQLLLTPYVLRLQGVVPAAPVAPLGPTSGEPPAQATASPAEAELTAPNLEGMTVEDARERWRDRGLVIIEDGEREGSGAAPGTIVQQRPPPGAALSSKEVRVIVAKAAEEAVVPDVVGMTEDEARGAVTASGLELADPQKEASDRPKGTVLRQIPAAGEKAKRGSIVRIVVAETPAIAVPKVNGMYLGQAKATLSEAGLVVGKIRRVEDAERGENYVLRQTPAPGEEVPPGTEVELVVVAPN